MELFGNTEQRLCDQACNIQKNRWFIKWKLETIKRMISGDTGHAATIVV